MKIVKIILLTIATLIIAMVIVYLYYDGTKTLVFSVDNAGGETFVYEKVQGDYSQTPKVMDRVYESLINDKIETDKGIGVFYDNPKTVDKQELRSDVGCIVENKDTSRLRLLDVKYKIKQTPVGKCIITEFPYKGMMSVMIGVFKVYPALHKYASSKGYKTGAITEIYDVPNKKTIYRAEILE